MRPQVDGASHSNDRVRDRLIPGPAWDPPGQVADQPGRVDQAASEQHIEPVCERVLAQQAVGVGGVQRLCQLLA